MKDNFVSLKQFAGLFGICIYSIFFHHSLNASSYSWECIKNRSYLIKEREFVNAKDEFKQFPTKLLSNLDSKSKFISLTYDLENGLATINGNSAKVTGFPAENNNFKEMPQKSLVISSNSLERSDSLKKIFEEDVKNIDLKIEGSEITETKTNNFLLNIEKDNANFVSTELNKIEEVKYKFKNKIITEDNLEIEEFIEVSTGKCHLLLEEN